MGAKQVVIGIGGATRSGKSTLAKNLVKFFKSDEKHIMHLDDYFSLELVFANNNNWELPKVIDWGELKSDMNEQKFIIHSHGRKIILVEGFLLFKEPLICNFDKMIYLWVDKEEAKKRRMDTKPVKEEYFENEVWPNFLYHNQHLAKMRANKGKKGGNDILVLDSTKESEDEMTQKAIKFILNEKDLERNDNHEQELLQSISEEYGKLSVDVKKKLTIDNKDKELEEKKK